MIASLRASALTFKRCTLEKAAFILLNLIDMGLTAFAMNIGANELNPLMRNVIDMPYASYIIKVGFPVFLAWLLPGKLLLPSIGLLVLVVGWNIYQLVLYFI